MIQSTVIIPVFNKAHLTQQCLDRLFAVSRRDGLEIIVVDDASRDRTDAVLAGYGDRIRVIQHNRNQGFAVSCNDGAARASAEYLVFLNNDTIPLTGWLEALIAHARAHPQLGAAGAKLLYPDGTIQHAGMVVGQDGYPYHLYVGFPVDHRVVNRSRQFQMVTGGCMLVPRTVFQAAGGFDTAFINGYEDVDLCLRLRRAGYEIHYCHESELYHLESVTDGRFTHHARNQQLYEQRWLSSVARDDVHYYLEDRLMELVHRGRYMEFRVSPELGVVNTDARADPLDALLVQRADQVARLVRENVNLRAADPGTGASRQAPRSGGTRSPQATGGLHSGRLLPTRGGSW